MIEKAVATVFTRKKKICQSLSIFQSSLTLISNRKGQHGSPSLQVTGRGQYLAILWRTNEVYNT